MARTKRRNHSFNREYGTYDDFCQDYSHWMWRYPCLNIEQIYERVRARYHRDHRAGMYGVPRWYRMLHGAHHTRRVEQQKLVLGLQRGEWEDHSPDARVRDSKHYWW